MLKLILLRLAMSLAVGFAVEMLHALVRWWWPPPAPQSVAARPGYQHYETDSQQSPGWLRWGAAAAALVALLLTQTGWAPLARLTALPLVLVVAPAVLDWFGPPRGDIEAVHSWQIGGGVAFSHYYGYLRLMRGQHGVRRRLQAHRNQHPQEADKLYTEAVIVLAPCNGRYPDGDLEGLQDDDLAGVGRQLYSLEPFRCFAGGNKRSYGGFSVHEVRSSDGKRSRHVALDAVSALKTLRKLRQHGPAGLSEEDFSSQMHQMLDTLVGVAAADDDLQGQVRIVRYNDGDHVGDLILEAMQKI